MLRKADSKCSNTLNVSPRSTALNTCDIAFVMRLVIHHSAWSLHPCEVMLEMLRAMPVRASFVQGAAKVRGFVRVKREVKNKIQ